MTRAVFTCVSIVALVLSPSSARAQMFELVGIRAQGMGGAFVAVADDATATWWNPAGLATGAYFNALAEYDRPRTPSDVDTRAAAIGLPSLGLSYYRLPVSQMRAAPPAETVQIDRLDQGYHTLFGVTVGQSVGDHLVLSSTLNVERAVDDTRGDLDIGAMARMGRIRLGVVMRNLTEPTFGEGAGALTLKRQARVGGAFLSGAHGTVAEAVIAVDGDLTSVTTVAGEEQHVAAGAELWLWQRTLGVRGGLSVDTKSDHGSASGGVSLMLRSGKYLKTYVDGQLTGGTDEARRGWSTGLRLTF